MLLRLPILALSLPLAAQSITLAEGNPSSLQIVTVAEAAPNGGDTVVAQDVELLPLEISGRTLAQELDPTASRRTVHNGIARVELGGGARLFRYRRNGGASWGFLHVRGDGGAAIVLELPGIGATAAGDPFADRIGIAPDGLHAAVPLATGGMYVLRLDGGTFASSGTAHRLAVPVTALVIETSVLVGSGHAFYQTANPDRVWRCALADGAVPADLTPPAAPGAILKDQMAMARDGSRVVFLYGPQQQQRLWTATTLGGSSVLPPPPSKYEEPGYLPEDPGEPAMLLSDDGSRLFFVDSDVRDELYLLDTNGVLPTLAITPDTVFQPYIGAHILPKFAGQALAVAIGDPGQMDWFRATLAAGGGSVTNLTNTGSATPPFPSGTIDAVQAATAGSTLLVAEQTASGLSLRSLDPTTGAHAVVQQGLSGPPAIGSSTTSVADVVTTSPSGYGLYRGIDGSLLGILPPEVRATPPAHGPGFAATWLHLAIGIGAVGWYLPDGTLVLGPLDLGLQQLVLTANGGTLTISSIVRYIAPGAFVVLNRPAAAVRLCLSGAGG